MSRLQLNSHRMLAVLVGVAWTTWGLAAELPRTVSVTGTGSAAAPPDMALFETAVVTEAETAAAAMEANSAAVRKLLETLKTLQIADKDVQTSRLDLSPLYSDSRNNQPPRIRGYAAHNQVTVKIRNLPQLGKVLDSLIAAGSNQLNGIRFDIDDPTGVLNQARTRAMADARAKAELYAHAAGVKVGAVISISENVPAEPRPMMVTARAMAMEAALPIATGEQELSSVVHVTYELVD